MPTLTCPHRIKCIRENPGQDTFLVLAARFFVFLQKVVAGMSCAPLGCLTPIIIPEDATTETGALLKALAKPCACKKAESQRLSDFNALHIPEETCG